MTYRLTKSRLTASRQCASRAFLMTHRPELADENVYDADRLAQGQEIGELAQQAFPHGRLIGHVEEPMRAVAETRRALSSGLPLFEAAFTNGETLVRVDILVPEGDGFHMIEVKASTRVKRYQLEDATIQFSVLREAGVPVKRVSIWHLNPAFSLPENRSLHGLFKREDVTAQVLELAPEYPQWVAGGRAAIGGEAVIPEPGPHCRSPHPCPFQGHCRGERTEYPLSLFTKEPKTIRALAKDGVTDARDVPVKALENPRNRRIAQALRTGTAVVNPEGARLVRSLPYPRFYLDFEAVQHAVPVWPGTRPWEQLPFQFSVHRHDRCGAVGHREYLDLSGQNPLRPLAEALLEALEGDGPILVYSGFERTMFGTLARHLPELAGALTALKARLVDLLPVAKEHYHHPQMQASWSIKSVLPTIDPGMSYDALSGVHNGIEAQQAYLRVISGRLSEHERRTIDRELREYCAVDTIGLMRFVEHVQQAA